jgi:hypothetical protein
MNGQEINQLVERLTQIDELEMSNIENALKSELKETEQTPVSTSYEFGLMESVFDQGELRLAKSGEWAIIILEPPEDSEIVEDDLDLTPWGEIDYLDINPDVPPEGVIAYTFDSNGVSVSFQFFEESRKLDAVVVEWGESE